MKKLHKNFVYILQIYLYLSICASLNAQSMESFVDSMMNTQEGIQMYEDILNAPSDFLDSTEIAASAYSLVEHYYTHMFITTHHPHYFNLTVDSLNPGMCFNGRFQHSHVNDTDLLGFRIFGGRLSTNKPIPDPKDPCTHDHETLSSLPLPQFSRPNVSFNPEFIFNLNPNDNVDLDNYLLPFRIIANYDRIELFEENSGLDHYVPSIPRNPPTGDRSIRLNRDRQHRHTNTMERTFIVDEDSLKFSFWFALVFEEPGHDLEDQPYFVATLIDKNETVVEEICYISSSAGIGLDYGIIDSISLSFRNWTCDYFDLTDFVGEEVTIRFVAAGCDLGGHFGYAYLANFCVPCEELPKIECESETGCDPIYCPEEFPLVFCQKLSLDTSLYKIDTIYSHLIYDGNIIAHLDAVYQGIDTIICFEISEELYNSLPKQGYDIYIYADVTHKESNFTSIISSNSFVPNLPDDRNNDFYVTCCPKLVLDTLDICDPEYLDLCGLVDLDTCDLEIIDISIEFFTSDTTSVLVGAEVDSLGNFCYRVSDSLLNQWDDICVRALVELLYYDPIVGDTLSHTENYINLNGDCLLDEECCPDEDPVPFTLNRILCLTGNDYSQATFDVEGSLYFSNLPDGYSYCGEQPVFNGGHIDYTTYQVTSNFIRFSGVMHITDDSQLLYDSTSNKYCLTGTLLVCDEHEQECEIDIIICFSTSQPDMCFEMEGLMCMNFIVNTTPYFPQSGNPPLVFGDDVWLPLVLAVPFIDKYVGEGDTCSIDTYWFQVFGVSPTSIPTHDLLHQSNVQKQGNETTGIFQQQLYIPVSDWNSYDYIEVKFWNNCGDTCTARDIPVVPVPGDGERSIVEIVEEEVKVSAYPIPFREQVMINYQLTQEKTEYRVYDSSGRLIDHGLLSDLEGEHILDTRQWSSGWYILEVNDPQLKDRSLILIKE